MKKKKKSSLRRGGSFCILQFIIIWLNNFTQQLLTGLDGLFLSMQHSYSSPQKHVILSHSLKHVLIRCWTKITPLFALHGAYRFYSTFSWLGSLSRKHLSQRYFNSRHKFTLGFEFFKPMGKPRRKSPCLLFSPEHCEWTVLPFHSGSLLLLIKFPITSMSDLLKRQPSVDTHAISAGNLNLLTG